LTSARKFFFRAAIIILFSAGFNETAAAQPQSQSREINSEDFVRGRPPAVAATKSAAGKSSGKAAGNKRRRKTYYLVPMRGQVASAAGATGTNPVAGSTVEQVGITIWRLRASTKDDEGPKIPARESGGGNWWTPERTQADTLFRIGERVRLSIESPRTGYLYVIDREQYADGTLGEPSVIFPTLRARGGDNRVSAGVLVEIPAQEDRVPYFNLTRHRADQVGELLTVLVTPEPIAEIKIGPEQHKLSQAEVREWERLWAAPETELFEMEGGAGAAWTEEERRAAGRGGRSLTQEEPTPQTIYRVRVKAGAPLLVTVPLSYDSGVGP
jgi:Domain of unknown function (DUF4384)